MANTFLFADNIQIGKSLCENNLASKAKEIIQKAKQLNCEIIIPIDVKTSKTLENANISHNKTLDNNTIKRTYNLVKLYNPPIL